MLAKLWERRFTAEDAAYSDSIRRHAAHDEQQQAFIIYAALFSPDQQHLLLAASPQPNHQPSKATLRAFALNGNLSSSPDVSINVPEAQQGSIYCLESLSQSLFASGGDEDIRIWRWSSLLKGEKAPHAALSVPQEKSAYRSVLPVPETNSLAFDKHSEKLYSGCGDGTVFQWDPEKGQIAGRLRGHTSNVYSVSTVSPTQIASASEDGTVRLWDTRAGECHAVLDPSTGQQITTQKDLEKYRTWQHCLAVDETGKWMVCGGGNRFLTLWYLPSLCAVATMPTPGTPQCVLFHEQQIISAGNENCIYHWEKNGKLAAKTTASSSSIFSITPSLNSKAIVATGNSSSVDIFVNPKIHSFSFKFCRAASPEE